MELLLKVGGSQDPIHWRDGQIIDIRPDGFHKEETLQRKHHCVLTLPGDFWQFRGTTNWKWPGQKVYGNIQKYITAVGSDGRYKWERTTQLDEKRLRRRDWFIDYKMLLDLGLITSSQFDAIYNKEKDPGPIFVERAFDQIIRHEDLHQRLASKYSLAKGSITAGMYQIGTGGGADYATIAAFEADIILPGDGPLTGDLTGEHQNEESAVAADVIFDVDTATYFLKLTAVSGAEHNGGAYGNGARLNFATYCSIDFNETNDGDLTDIEVSKLAFDISGAGNTAFQTVDMGGYFIANRNLIAGNADTSYGVILWNLDDAIDFDITNNIIYGVGAEGTECGIRLHSGWKSCTWYVCNNTICKCYNNFCQPGASTNETVVVKNNIAQGDTGGADYVDGGAGFGTTGHNVSEDATSPDAAYQSKDVHTNSVFLDYNNDDYRLDPAGDATNLAILDDGEDLSGTFTDDIQGQTRSTWYIGASEIVSAEGPTMPVFDYYYNQARL